MTVCMPVRVRMPFIRPPAVRRETGMQIKPDQERVLLRIENERNRREGKEEETE